MKTIAKLVSTVLFAVLSILSVNGEPLEVGAKAPDAKGTDQDGNAVDLGELCNSGFTLVFFYPKANTGGCRKQVCSLRDAYEELQEKGVTIVGVSVDSQSDQKRFHEDNQLPYPLIADEKGEIVAAFGVPRRGSVAARQAFLFKDGTLVWRDLTASTSEQAQDVLKALEELSKEEEEKK